MNNNSFQSVIDTFDVFLAAIRDTIVMSLVSLVIAGVIGLALGLLLYATRPGNVSATAPRTRCSTCS